MAYILYIFILVPINLIGVVLTFPLAFIIGNIPLKLVGATTVPFGNQVQDYSLLFHGGKLRTIA